MEVNQTKQQQPMNIFAQIAKGVETTNLNVVDLFKLVEEQALVIAETKEKIDAIYNALYPKQSEPDADGAETDNK